MKRAICLFLALVSVVLLLCPNAQAAPAAQEDYIAANHTRGNGRPYYIMVNRAQNTVTVYGLDAGNYYTVPVKAMICSVGRKGHATPTGTFTIGGRWTWLHMFDGSYGQYATQISGNILFHSVCYSKKDPSTLMSYEYNGLGAPASLGCVRLQTVDAKWIYDNCARGTKVTVYDGVNSPGPLGKPEKAVSHISEEQENGWDPTDPRPENPWLQAQASGGAQEPADPAAPPPEGQAVSYALAAQTLYELSGETGLADAAGATGWAVRNHLLDGMADRGDFDPSAPVTRQEMVTMLYRYETGYCGREARLLDDLARYSDGQQVDASAMDAMRWAVGSGLIVGTLSGALNPKDYATRAQMDIILQRYIVK